MKRKAPPQKGVRPPTPYEEQLKKIEILKAERDKWQKRIEQEELALSFMEKPKQ